MSDYSHAYDRCRSFINSNFVESPKQQVRHPVALTISRQVYSCSHAIAEILIELLNKDEELGDKKWALFDRDLVHKILQDHNLPKRIAQYMPEDREKSFTSTINEILGVHPSMWDLFHYTCSTIHKLAQVGNTILIGRGAHIVTRGMPHVLRVRIIAPKEMRIQRAADMLNISRAEASKKVSQDDHARGAYVRCHFDESIDDPAAYDMVLNTETIDEESAALILYQALVVR